MSESTLNILIRRGLDNFRLAVDMEAGKGITGIIGPSGAGKSTLLQCVSGLIKPHQGRIRFGETIFVDTDTRVFLPPEQRRIGYVFQEARLFPHFNVAQNLNYGRKRRGQASDATWSEVIELLGLQPLLARSPHHLSGGEAQRVALGRALLSAPSLLLMDEPLASLDIKRRREIMPYLEALQDKLDMPTLFVSHNLDEVLRLADRVVVLHKGAIVAAGNVTETLNRLDIQALIVGEIEDNDDSSAILDARIVAHDDNDGVSELDMAGQRIVLSRIQAPIGTSVRLRLHARDVALATVRPEHLSIQNVIAGRVASIDAIGPSRMEVVVAIGEGAHLHLRARITRRAARQLALETGKPVWALIKSVALA